jgi:hypothetical protein
MEQYCNGLHRMFVRRSRSCHIKLELLQVSCPQGLSEYCSDRNTKAKLPHSHFQANLPGEKGLATSLLQSHCYILGSSRCELQL